MPKQIFCLLLIFCITRLSAQTSLQLILTPQFSQPLTFQNNKNTTRSLPAFCGTIGLRKATETSNERLQWIWSAVVGFSSYNFRYRLPQQDYPFLPYDIVNLPNRGGIIPYLQPGLGIGYLANNPKLKGVRINILTGLRFYGSFIAEQADYSNTTNPPNGQQILVFDMFLETRTLPFLFLNIQIEKQFSRPESAWVLSGGIDFCVLPGNQLTGEYRFLPGTGSGFSGSVFQNSSSLGLFFAVGRR
ncbi:MAG: hypothetical protein MUC87_04175 [Bacteroidia bacterium]|jgi:hypothetical protein|nr:hypothetical protein [Bacteroidia bacterium]